VNAYGVVEQFEARVADQFGLKYGVAVDCCTSGIFLSMKYRQTTEKCSGLHAAYLPSLTYISVPFAVMDAGVTPIFTQVCWSTYYSIRPWGLIDAAKLWRHARDATSIPEHRMALWCVSFHIKKPIPIGRGGMILTDDAKAVEWLRRARYDGRRADVPLQFDDIAERGWHRYMTPEQAARGMALMDIYPNGVDIPPEAYPDLSKMPVFQRHE
jgi:dTDP-4-amino-4,6-dideoxygalactose transaminase